MAPTVTGIALGVVGAYYATRLLASMLFGILPHDVVAFVLTPRVLLIVAILAACLPAARAARISPASALRHE